MFFNRENCPLSVPGEHYNFCIKSTNAKAFGKAPVHYCFDGLLCSVPDEVGLVPYTKDDKVVEPAIKLTEQLIRSTMARFQRRVESIPPLGHPRFTLIFWLHCRGQWLHNT